MVQALILTIFVVLSTNCAVYNKVEIDYRMEKVVNSSEI